MVQWIHQGGSSFKWATNIARLESRYDAVGASKTRDVCVLNPGIGNFYRNIYCLLYLKNENKIKINQGCPIQETIHYPY